jgi:hypothetical protein
MISAPGCSLSTGRTVSLLPLCAIRSLTFKEVVVLLRLKVNSDEVCSSSHALREEYSSSWHARPVGNDRITSHEENVIFIFEESATLRSNQLVNDEDRKA